MSNKHLPGYHFTSEIVWASFGIVRKKHCFSEEHPNTTGSRLQFHPFYLLENLKNY